MKKIAVVHRGKGVVGIILQVLISVRRLPAYAGGEATVWFSWKCGVKERKLAVSVCLHDEADWRLLVVKML